MPWIALILFGALVLAFYFFWRSRNQGVGTLPTEDTMPQAFSFDEDGARALASRKFAIVAARQWNKGKRQKVRVELKPLPTFDNLKPPPEKQIDALLAAVANPIVYADETGEQLSTFDPPLTITIHYKNQDAAKTKSSADGVPQLSIVSAYQSPDGWRFEKLPTIVTPNSNGEGGTLVAQLKTLEPTDPLFVGAP